MTFLTEADLDLAQTLGDIGGPFTLRKVTDGAYNPGTGAPASSTADFTVNGAMTTYAGNFVNGTTVLSDDRKLVVSALGLAAIPAVNDIVIGPGALSQKVVGVNPVSPSGTPIAYICQLRR